MSLTGHLEDIGLGELLQIVSLSRKSGFINVTSRGREGRIVFSLGKVTEASSTTFKQSFGELLIRKGIITLPQMRQALDVQAGEQGSERLGSIISRLFRIPDETVEAVGREQVENVVQSLFEWAEGTFEFHVDEVPDEPAVPDSQTVTLSEGLDPDRLAVAGARIAEELDDAPVPFPVLPEIGASDSSPRPAPLVPLSPDTLPPVVIVDDDDATRRVLEEVVRDAGYRVWSFGRTEDTLIKIDSLVSAGERPLVVVDLIMPRMDGSGILGGLELLDFLSTNYPAIPAVVLSDYHNEEAERKVRDLRCSFAIKPRKGEVEQAVETLRETLLRLLQMAAGAPPDGEQVNIAEELRIELGEPAQEAERVAPSAGMPLLKGMLEELHSPLLGPDVILLVLRFASEFMNRAVLFLVRDGRIGGVGQFGIAGKNAAARVRGLTIPLIESSLFAAVFENKVPGRVVPDRSEWNLHLFEQLGGGRPKEVFVAPIISAGAIVGILYGDNLPEKAPIGETESLEIFLSQAGPAMERALSYHGEGNTGEGVDR